MILVTQDAQEKLEDIIGLDDGAGPGVRVSAVRGPHGCVHGWSLEVDEDEQPDDVVFTFGRLRVLVDAQLVESLEGAKIDFRSGGSGSGFSIVAPKTSAHGDGGGCGNH